MPYAKDRLAVDERVLGILLLCLGIGSLVAMFFTGMLSSRFGTRPVILVSGFGLAAVLPWLVIASTPFTLGVTLLLFGATLGSLDVAMNIHAVEVERNVGRPLLSGFHALYSLGGFAGAAFITLLLSAGLGPFECVLIGSVLMLLALVASWPRLLRSKTADGEPHFAWPRGVVLVIAALTAITFLAEGALLDWSALLITGMGLVDVEQGGIGYMLFYRHDAGEILRRRTDREDWCIAIICGKPGGHRRLHAVADGACRGRLDGGFHPDRPGCSKLCQSCSAFG